MIVRRLLPLIAAAFLAGCGTSPPTRYYTLTAVPRSGPPVASVRSPVTVAQVNVPPALDRNSLVRSTGGTTVDVSDQDRWVAPLGSMVRNVLSQNLAMRLPKGSVVLPDAPSPPHTATIVLSIAQFEPAADGRIVLKGSWAVLKDGADKPVLRRDMALETTAPGADGAAQAQGMSQLLGDLASQIASALGGMA